MKKYLCALLALPLITAVTSTVKADFSQQCIDKIDETVKSEGYPGFRQVLESKKWEEFKSKVGYPQDTGKWSEIVRACVTPKADVDCKGCNCDEDDACTSHCMCCWVGTSGC